MHSYILLAKLHMVFALLSTVGIVFLIIWAAKTLPTKKLKKFGIWFVAIGIVGVLLLSHGGKYKKFGMYHKSGTDGFSQGMVQALSDRGLTMTEEEVGEMMVEVKTKMKESFGKKK